MSAHTSTEIAGRITAIESTNKATTRIYEKLENTVDALRAYTEALNKNAAVNDERVKMQESQLQELRLQMRGDKSETQRDIQQLHDRVTSEIRNVGDKIESSEKKVLEKIDKLETKWSNVDEKQEDKISILSKVMHKWQWFILGAAVIIGAWTHKLGAISWILKIITGDGTP